jgi:hypothetical protein
VQEKFLASTSSPPEGSRLVYRPALLGRCRLHFVQATTKTDEWVSRAFFSPLESQEGDSVWDEAQVVDADALELETDPETGAGFAAVPAALTQSRSFPAWEKALKNHAYQNDVIAVWKCAELKMASHAGESEADFRVRLVQSAREARDSNVEKLRAQYASKVATIQSRIRTAEDRLAREKSQASRATMDSMVSIGSSILGALFGRKLVSRANIGKAATSARSFGRAAEQRGDVDRAEENVEALQRQIADLEAKLQSEIDRVDQSCRPEAFALDESNIRPRKSDIQFESIVVAWAPWLVDAAGGSKAAFEPGV